MAVLRALFRRNQGQSAVELALVFPLFLLILLGVVDLGRAVYYHNSLSNLAREGARSGVIIASQSQWLIDGNAAGKDSPRIYSGIDSYSGTNTIVGSIASKAVAFDLSRMTVELQAELGTWRSQASPLTVGVRYPYEPILTNWVGLSPTITLTAQTTMRIQ